MVSIMVLQKFFGPSSNIAKGHKDHEGMKKIDSFYKGSTKRPQMVTPGRYEDLEKHYRGADDDDAYIIDKLTAVYLSGSIHDEHQPCHLKVRPEIRNFAPDHCVTTCTKEYGNPCERFCPAQVYNIVDDAEAKVENVSKLTFRTVFIVKPVTFETLIKS